MKKVLLILTFVLLVTFTTACGGMSISEKQYNKISNYVLENENTIVHKDSIEFFDYDTVGLCVGGVYYGYYDADYISVSGSVNITGNKIIIHIETQPEDRSKSAYY